MTETKDKAPANATGVDLSAFTAASEEGQVMPVLSPGTGEPLMDDAGVAVTITLLSKDSKPYRKAQRQITDRRLSRRTGAKLTAERLESEANEVLARCTIAWHGIVFQGEALDCTYANAKKVYDALPWVKELVDEFISERANFLES